VHNPQHSSEMDDSEVNDKVIGEFDVYASKKLGQHEFDVRLNPYLLPTGPNFLSNPLIF
jgi:hypothetical protein